MRTWSTDERGLSAEREVVDLGPRAGLPARDVGGVEDLSAGVEDVGDSRRLVLACRAADRYGPGAGTAFTTLIPGRPPQVSLAPAGTPIPGGWAWVAPRPGGPIGECG